MSNRHATSDMRDRRREQDRRERRSRSRSPSRRTPEGRSSALARMFDEVERRRSQPDSGTIEDSNRSRPPTLVGSVRPVVRPTRQTSLLVRPPGPVPRPPLVIPSPSRSRSRRRFPSPSRPVIINVDDERPVTPTLDPIAAIEELRQAQRMRALIDDCQRAVDSDRGATASTSRGAAVPVTCTVTAPTDVASVATTTRAVNTVTAATSTDIVRSSAVATNTVGVQAADMATTTDDIPRTDTRDASTSAAGEGITEVIPFGVADYDAQILCRTLNVYLGVRGTFRLTEDFRIVFADGVWATFGTPIRVNLTRMSRDFRVPMWRLAVFFTQHHSSELPELMSEQGEVWLAIPGDPDTTSLVHAVLTALLFHTGINF